MKDEIARLSAEVTQLKRELAEEKAATDDSQVQRELKEEAEARVLQLQDAWERRVDEVNSLRIVRKVYRQSLREAIHLIEQLADQQAMADDWYVEHLNELKTLVNDPD